MGLCGRVVTGDEVVEGPHTLGSLQAVFRTKGVEGLDNTGSRQEGLQVCSGAAVAFWRSVYGTTGPSQWVARIDQHLALQVPGRQHLGSNRVGQSSIPNSAPTPKRCVPPGRQPE